LGLAGEVAVRVQQGLDALEDRPRLVAPERRVGCCRVGLDLRDGEGAATLFEFHGWAVICVSDLDDPPLEVFN
jgi:hypothetical protein